MSANGINGHKRPHVVSLGNPEWIGDDYLSKFKETYDFSVLEATNREETIERLPQHIKEHGPIDAFIVRMGTPPFEPFDEGLLKDLAGSCKVIASASAGFNEFDVDWMAEQGIYFCNTIDAVAEATADMAVFLLLAILRNATNGERSANAGTWRFGKAMVHPAKDPSGMTLGIVGMGTIGKHVARKARAFNMKIQYHNRNQLSTDIETTYGAQYCPSLHELLSTSDAISINCPLNAKTTGLIGKAEFDAMKDGVFFVNTARGPVLDEAAFKEALECGKIKRAGLDVFCNEPKVDEYFLNNDKVTVQPHIGGWTDVSFHKCEKECFENIRAFFETGNPISPVREIKARM